MNKILKLFKKFCISRRFEIVNSCVYFASKNRCQEHNAYYIKKRVYLFKFFFIEDYIKLDEDFFRRFLLESKVFSDTMFCSVESAENFVDLYKKYGQFAFIKNPELRDDVMKKYNIHNNKSKVIW